MMAFNGVRNSWLMLERKVDLALFAFSASFFALRTRFSASFTAVISILIPDISMARPAPLKIACPRDRIQKILPS